MASAIVFHRLPRQCQKAILWILANQDEVLRSMSTPYLLSMIPSVRLVASVWRLREEDVADLIIRIRAGKKAAVDGMNQAIASNAARRGRL